MLSRLLQHPLRSPLCWWILLASGGLGAQLPVHTPVDLNRGQEAGSLALHTEVLLEADHDYRAHGALPTAVPFRQPAVGASVGPGSYVWQRVGVVNSAERAVDYFVMPNRRVDSIWLYVVDTDGSLMHQDHYYTGGSSPVQLVSVWPGTFHLYLRPGERASVLLRTFYRHGWAETRAAELTFAPVRVTVNNKMQAVGWHSLYTGLTIAIALLSLLSYGLFRNRAFIYFALVNLSFAGYFLDANLLLGLVGMNGVENGDYGYLSHFIANIIIWLTCFGTAYVRLPFRMPRYFRFLVVLSCLAVLGQYLPGWLGLSRVAIANTANFSLLIWIFATMAPIGRLALQGQRSGIRLLSATLLLLLPGVVFIVQIIANATYNSYTLIAFELGTLGFSGVVFAGLYTEVNQIRTKARTVAAQNELNTRFFANISHAFRTPLTLIMGPLEQLLRRHSSGSEEERLLRVAHENAQRQLQLVNRVLQLSRLEADADTLQLETMNLVSFVRRATLAFSSIASQRGVTLRLPTFPGEVAIRIDRGKVEDILYNLLSNALKFTPSGGEVAVSIATEKGEVSISISDTGTGIRKDRLANIFDRFIQSESGQGQGSSGSGLGLSLVRELVRLHGGRVYAESEWGSGAVFTVVLPLAELQGAAQVKPDQQPELSTLPLHAAATLPTGADPADAPLVLVVEDNADLRNLIRYTLRDIYRVAEAVNGEEGLQLAAKLQPALIVSDVMMPVMDGYELCRTLKEQLATSHIPVILLTAKASAEARIEGLDTGADDYLTKPFNDLELLARVRNLLETRRVLRQRYADRIELRPTEVATTPVDADFLQQVMETVEAELANEDFKVKDLSRSLGLSSASLNRKLRSLLGQSTKQFVQSVRLQRAVDLLNGRELNVAEVADQCGFSSSAYFIRAFREKYGHTPGSLLRDEVG